MKKGKLARVIGFDIPEAHLFNIGDIIELEEWYENCCYFFNGTDEDGFKIGQTLVDGEFEWIEEGDEK